MAASMMINPGIVKMEYAVRGAIPQRAAELARQGRRIIPCHIGNPQALGQKPISFYRQVLSYLENPPGIERDRSLRRMVDRDSRPFGSLGDVFTSEYVLDLAEDLLSKLGTGLGAYTESRGPRFIRESIATFIDARDRIESLRGTPSDPDSIFLTNGASEAVRYLIHLLIADSHDGIMVPIPQYPLYSAVIKAARGVQVNYYPDEESGWTLERPMLEESIKQAHEEGVVVKAIVVINPANPTGAILSQGSIREIVDFAEDHGLAIIADEVYQENVYGEEFVSFARIVGKRDVPLFSLHSTSKGFCGECGRRGGYLEIRNPPHLEDCRQSFTDVLLKEASVSLCSNTSGQVLTYLMVNPPPAGAIPHDRFIQERSGILSGLCERASMIKASFDQMEGVTCFGRIGAMYLFPRLGRLPAETNDFDYCMSLLEATGLCTINGAGFGQRAGTQHLRIAFLPPREMLESVLPEWIDFHNRYVMQAVN